jgi:hypothetical protein
MGWTERMVGRMDGRGYVGRAVGRWARRWVGARWIVKIVRVVGSGRKYLSGGERGDRLTEVFGGDDYLVPREGWLVPVTFRFRFGRGGRGSITYFKLTHFKLTPRSQVRVSTPASFLSL